MNLFDSGFSVVVSIFLLWVALLLLGFRFAAWRRERHPGQLIEDHKVHHRKIEALKRAGRS